MSEELDLMFRLCHEAWDHLPDPDNAKALLAYAERLREDAKLVESCRAGELAAAETLRERVAALIEALREARATLNDNGETALTAAIDAALAGAPAVDGWISVNERLPDVPGWYLVTLTVSPVGVVAMMAWEGMPGSLWRDDSGELRPHAPVLAWRSLPAPYQPPAVERDGWIPVSERTPEYPVGVIAVYAWPTQSHEVPAWGKAQYHQGVWYSVEHGSRVPMCWRPLPPPSLRTS